MKLTSLVALFGAALALPSGPLSPRACTNPTVRKEWRNATVTDRLAYLSAAVCITKTPSRLGIHPNATLHDDFSFVHALLSDFSTSIWSTPPLPSQKHVCSY
jgi:tyrosinase